MIIGKKKCAVRASVQCKHPGTGHWPIPGCFFFSSIIAHPRRAVGNYGRGCRQETIYLTNDTAFCKIVGKKIHDFFVTFRKEFLLWESVIILTAIAKIVTVEIIVHVVKTAIVEKVVIAINNRL